MKWAAWSSRGRKSVRAFDVLVMSSVVALLYFAFWMTWTRPDLSRSRSRLTDPFHKIVWHIIFILSPMACVVLHIMRTYVSNCNLAGKDIGFLRRLRDMWQQQGHSMVVLPLS